MRIRRDGELVFTTSIFCGERSPCMERLYQNHRKNATAYRAQKLRFAVICNAHG